MKTSGFRPERTTSVECVTRPKIEALRKMKYQKLDFLKIENLKMFSVRELGKCATSRTTIHQSQEMWELPLIGHKKRRHILFSYNYIKSAKKQK